MATKQETIDSLVPTSNYLGSFVRKMITDITVESKLTVEYLKKGDVLILKSQVKYRPSVVIKVKETYVIVIPLTSSENEHCLCESKSRFLKDGCFGNNFEIVPMELAKASFVSVYDNPKLLNNAIKELREFIKKNI